MTIIWIILGCFFAVQQMWLYYIAGMHLQKMKHADLLTKPQKVLGYTLLAQGLLLDFILNMTVGAVFFRDWWHWGEWTLSARIWRLSNAEPGGRQRLALWVRTKLLDNADYRGYHKA